MARMKNEKRPDGRVKSKVYLGLDKDGKKKYKYVYASNNRELEEKVNEVKMKLGKGIDVLAERDTFGYWSDKWIKLKKLDVSDKRWHTYDSRRHYLDDLEDVSITKIKPAHIQEIIVEAATAPSEATGKPLARQTLTEIKNIASQIFKLAIENRVMDFNPAISVKIPNGTSQSTREPISVDLLQRNIRATDYSTNRNTAANASANAAVFLVVTQKHY